MSCSRSRSRFPLRAWPGLLCGLAFVLVLASGPSERADAQQGPLPKTQVVESKWTNGNVMERKEGYKDLEGSWVNHGKYQFYHLNGNLREELSFRRGKREGDAKFFHPNGKLAGTVLFADDLRQGLEVQLDDQGRKFASQNFVDDKPQGQWHWYYENGQTCLVETYQEGKKTGPWIWSYENGQKGIVGQFKEDEQDGEWIYYDRAGQLTERRTYRAGELLNPPKLLESKVSAPSGSAPQK